MPSDLIAPIISFNFQKSCNLRNRRALKTFLVNIFHHEKKGLSSLSYVFCSDEYLLDVNQRFLNHDYYTDIITFDLSDNARSTIGEIYISIDRVRENARSLDIGFERELHRVIFHGALHLCGYKDKLPRQIKAMRAAEDACLERYFGEYLAS
jgi:probable rRNA maturation factor